MTDIPRRGLLPLSLRRTWRRFWRGLGHAPFELVYHDRYRTAFPDVPNDPLRAERILAFLVSEGLVLERCVHRPEPVWLKTVALVHGDEYLDAMPDAATLTSIMGTEISDDQVDRLIDVQRLHAGGTLMATRRARQRGVAVNLGGGFHHARAAAGGGFCMINDVAVAIADERRRGFRGRVLVVDLDLHDGDGTREIFADDPDVHTFSIHARHWGPTDALASTAVELGSGVDDGTYLAAVERHLAPVFEHHQPQLVFYLAGCDPAHDDFLGDWQISEPALLDRDRRVVSLVHSGLYRPPLVILLAGGYSPEAWRYSARFLSTLGRRAAVEPPSTVEITLARYRYLSSWIDSRELGGGEDGGDFGLTSDDLALPGWGPTRETRFLGFYSRHGIELVLERGGLLDRLRDLGFAHPTLELQLEDSGGGDTLRIVGDPSRRELLVELQVRRDRRAVPGCELLSVEWLLMQNPRARFGPGRPHLPGQEHPGLGMLYDLVALLTLACERLHLDGLVFVPSQFHVAAYAQSRLAFLKPETRARFRALLELFRDTPLPEATRAVAGGQVVDARSGAVFRWQPEPMLLPVTDRLRRLMAIGEEEQGPRFRFRRIEDAQAS